MAGFAVLGLPDVYMSSLGAFLDAFYLVGQQVGSVFKKRARVEMQTPVHLVSPGGAMVHMVGGRQLPADVDIGNAETAYDLVHIPGFVVGDEQGLDARLSAAGPVCRWLRRQGDAGALLSASGTAVFLLAQAGLLKGGSIAMSRPLIPLFRRRFPAIVVAQGNAVVECGDVITASGVAADAQLLTRLVERVASPELARWLGDVAGLRQTGSNELVDDPLVANAQLWLENRFARDISIAELAAAMSVTQQTLLRHFRRRLQMTPQAYLRKVRVEAAQRLLSRTNRPVAQIASLVGYNDVQSFRKAFQRISGTSPGRYRSLGSGVPRVTTPDPR